MSVEPLAELPATYSPSEIAARWGVAPETVRACIRSGALAAFRAGPRLIRVRADKLAEYEARQTRKAWTHEEREARQARDRKLTVMLRAVKGAHGRRHTLITRT